MLPRAPLIAVALLALASSQACAQSLWKWQDALALDAGFDLDQAQLPSVTSLTSKGKGTLRAALAERGPRLIVFEVGGVIDLEMKSLQSEEPQVYIAGQTAPGPGITLIRGGMSITGNQTV